MTSVDILLRPERIVRGNGYVGHSTGLQNPIEMGKRTRFILDMFEHIEHAGCRNRIFRQFQILKGRAYHRKAASA